MRDIENLAVQLYTMRQLGDMAAILDAVKAAGYRKVELQATHLEIVDEIEPLLKERGLAVIAGHASIAMLRERMEWLLQVCERLGIDTLFMPSTPPELRASPEPFWSELGAELAGYARDLAAKGITLGYHNHDWEVAVQPDGRMALEALLDASAGSPLVWEVDVAWLDRGLADSNALMHKYRDRILAIHLKDLSGPADSLPRPYQGAGGEDGWAAVGDGAMGWDKLLPLCRELGATMFIVEHDMPVDAVDSITRSYANLARMEG